MTITRLKTLLPALIIAVFSFVWPAASSAQTYPARPIRLLVGFAPGGATDIAARALGQKLSEIIGQSIVVENRPGASGNLAAELVARASPDGYTVYLANATIAIPSLFKKLPFDVKKDFAPVSLVGLGPSALAVHPSVPVKSVKELVALAKRRPGELNYASGGTGNITHLAMELFIFMTGVDMVHIPYKGGGPSTIAVVSGEAHLLFASVASTLAQIKQGKLRAIAVSSAKRSIALPDVPTVSEAGLTGYDASSWYGVIAPAKTPREVVSKLSDDIVKALDAPELKERLTNQGIEPAESGASEFARYLDSEMAKWAKVVKAAGIPPQ